MRFALLVSVLFITFAVDAQDKSVKSTIKPQVMPSEQPSVAKPAQDSAIIAPQGPGAVSPAGGISPSVPTTLLSSLVNAFAKMERGRQYFGDDPPEHADWSTYEYPDTHKFYYGGAGAGNIGSGLCTAKNANRTQVKAGYCGMLSDALRAEGSCANRAMNQILATAGPSGNGIGDLGQYCSTFGSFSGATERVMVFQQILATLITQESGWNSHAEEPPWTKNGMPMGGKGLFQIGVSDKSQDPDCRGIDAQTIFDPATNIKCGACIALTNLAKDRTMGHGSGDSNARGMARYFGPLRDSQVKKRSAMAAAVNDYCVASTAGGNSSSFAPVTGSAK